jgi:GNAT superfamily N-acetyltransferase
VLPPIAADATLGSRVGYNLAVPSELPDFVIRVAAADDLAAIASLRSLWDDANDHDLEGRIASWLADEGDRRTIWLAAVSGAPVGMTSMFEYRRMPHPGRPDSRWGYVGNMFVREDFRDRGIGSALLAALIAAADERSYVRLVVSPSARAQSLYRRAGFIVPDPARDDRLFVRRPRTSPRADMYV